MEHSEFIILTSFLGIQAFYHWCQEHIGHSALLEKLSHAHLVVILFHPAVIHGVQDYIIHFVIYSGKVIAAH